MRASYIKILSRSMIGLIIVVLLAVLINYLFILLNRAQSVKKAPEILGSEMRRAATGIEISPNRDGVTGSKIRAQELLETRMGKQLLRGIEAWDFNADGSVHNEIRSERAEYDQEGNTADFSGDVRVFFGEDIEVRTDSLRYNLKSGIGETADPLQFFYGESRGKARGMRLDREHKNLELKSEVDLVFLRPRARPGGGTETEKIRASADHAYGSEEVGQILLQGRSRVESETALLVADSLVARINPEQKRVTSLTADGEASYESREADETRQISGHRIIFDIGEASGVLEKISVLGEAGFASSSPVGEQSLNGAEIFLYIDPGKSLPQRVESHTGVRFRMKRGTEQTLLTGDRLTAKFVQGTENFESVHGAGQARMSVEGDPGSPGQELQAEEILMSFRQAEGQAAFEKLRANGSARWTLKPPQSKAAGRREPARTLEASLLEMVYSGKGDCLESGHATGKVVVTEASGDQAAQTQVRRLLADDARFYFFSGGNQLKSINAQGHVQVAYEKKSGAAGKLTVERFRAESEKLRASFDLVDGESAVSTVSQWGGFRYWDDSWTATARQCDYDARKDVLVLQGSPRITSDETGSTTGERVEFDQKQKVLSVHKRVRSRLAAKGDGSFFGASSSSSPSIVIADTLKYWTEAGRARYEGGVQLLSENGQLQAKVLEVLKGGERVDAQGGIVHLVPMREASGTGKQQEESKKTRNSEDVPMIIKSSGLTYLKERNAITYTGDVNLHSMDLDLWSGSLDAVLDKEGKRVESATARENVRIHQQNRECKGDTAFYYLDPGKFVVVGNPAEIFDPGKGWSFARRLTSFTTDDRILIEKQ